jgi:hypothetical protein
VDGINLEVIGQLLRRPTVPTNQAGRLLFLRIPDTQVD